MKNYVKKSQLKNVPPPEISRYVAPPKPAETPPEGYRLVEDDKHQIGVRDMVFMGGRNSNWQPARRAGEVGETKRFSTARAVASPRR